MTNFMHHFMQVVREIQHSRNGVTVTTEDGCIYEANYVVLSVSIGVLQSDLISFTPPLPVRFLLLFIPCCLWLYYLLITLWLSPPPRPRMPPIIYDDVSYLLPLDLWTSIERPKMGGGESWPFNIHNTINISRALSVLWGGGIFVLTWLLLIYISKWPGPLFNFSFSGSEFMEWQGLLYWLMT